MNKPPKILLISTDEFSGVKPALCTALRKAGCEVIEGEPTLRHLQLRPWHALHMSLHALLVYRGSFRRYLERTYSAYAARSKSCHALAGRTPGIDAVILLQTFAHSFWLKRLPGVRYAVYTDHANLMSKNLPDTGYDIPEKKVYAKWNKLERDLLHQQDCIFVMGAYVKPALIDLYGVEPARVTVVGAGPGSPIDIEDDGVHKNYHGRNLLFVGKDPARKGVEVAIKALTRVRERYPDARLHVVGSQVAEVDGVICHGRISSEKLKQLFYDAQIFVFPAHREPLGLVLLEAMWSKAVCIGTTTGAMPEIIHERKTGHLVTPNDDTAIAEHICALFADPARLQSMAEAGYASARGYWSWDKVVQRILNQLFQEEHSTNKSAHPLNQDFPLHIQGT